MGRLTTTHLSLIFGVFKCPPFHMCLANSSETWLYYKFWHALSRDGVHFFGWWNSIYANLQPPYLHKVYWKLYNSHIPDDDYEHTKAVFNDYKCRILGDYDHDLYLRSDVLLLADIFETFRNTLGALHIFNRSTYNIFYLFVSNFWRHKVSKIHESGTCKSKFWFNSFIAMFFCPS